MGVRSRLRRIFSKSQPTTPPKEVLSEEQYVQRANGLLERIREGMAEVKNNGEPLKVLKFAEQFAWLAWQSNTSSKFDTELDQHIIDAVRSLHETTSGEGKKDKVLYVTSGLLSQGGVTQLLLNLVEGHQGGKFDTKVFSTEQFRPTDRGHVRVKRVMSIVDVDFVSQAENFSSSIQELREAIIDFDPCLLVYLLAPQDVVAGGIPILFPDRRHLFVNASHHVATIGSFQFDGIVDIMPDFYKETKRSKRNPKIEYISLGGRMSRKQGEKVVPADIRSTVGIAQDTLVSMTIGNPHKCLWAGNKAYGRSLASALKANPSWHHVLVAKDMELVKDSIVEVEPLLAPRIHCLPPTTEILAVLKACDLYINSFPMSGALSMLDTMTVSRPSVFGPYDFEWFGIEEFTAIDENSLRELSTWLMSDEEARKRSAQASAEVYDKGFDPSIMIKSYESLYAGLKKSNLSPAAEVKMQVTGVRNADVLGILNKVKSEIEQLYS